jgi:serine/threonine protein kinase
MPDSTRPEASDEALLRVAALAADGRSAGDSASLGAESQRVAQNLSRLAALKAAFDRLDAAPGPDPDPTAAPGPGGWGHLTLQAELGRGGFGVVYRAFDPILQREVALKLQREDLDAARAGSWIEEARKLARVRHPNVLAVHGADVNEGRAGLWSDLLQGETLAARLTREACLARPALIELLRQLGSALDAVHAAGLVHGDVKPENVMLEGGHAVLMDFGAAAQRGATPRFGTPGAMAPELLAGGRASGASDIYSLGVMLCRAALPAVEREERAPGEIERSLRRRLGAPLQRLLLRLMRDEPAARPPPGAILVELDRIEALPRRRARRLAVGAVMLALGLGLTVSLWQAQEAQRQAQRASLEAERAERSLDFLTGMLRGGDPRRGQQPASIEELLASGIARAEADLGEDPILHGTVLLRLSEVLLGRTDFVQARDLADRALGLLAEHLEPGDRRLADADLVAGGARYRLGEESAAEPHLRSAAEAFRRLGDVGKETQALAGVAGILRNSQDFQAAMDLQSRILRRIDSELGRDSYEAGAGRYALGVFAIDAGEYATAEQALREAIEVLAAVGAPGEADHASALLTLASLLDRLGRSDEAGPLFAQGVEATASRFGEDSHALASARFSQGIYWLGQGQPAQADVAFRQVLAAEMATPVQRAHAQRYLGRALHDQGRFDEAIARLAEAEQAYRALGGTSMIEQAHRSAADRGHSLNQLGRAQEAVALLQEAVDGIRSVRGERHYNLIQPLIHLSKAQQAAGDLGAARASAEAALAMAEVVLGPEHRFSNEARARLQSVAEAGPEP